MSVPRVGGNHMENKESIPTDAVGDVCRMIGKLIGDVRHLVNFHGIDDRAWEKLDEDTDIRDWVGELTLNAIGWAELQILVDQWQKNVLLLSAYAEPEIVRLREEFQHELDKVVEFRNLIAPHSDLFGYESID